MFIRLTNSRGESFLMNMVYIVEVCGVINRENNTNAQLISSTKENIYEVQETIEEIYTKMNEKKGE